ncbi:MAG: menaquinone biosynthesis protein [Bryobacteraceae bacterium]
MLSADSLERPRVCAVSYFNTVPLVWGMLHGPQRNIFDLTFAVPSLCADRLRRGEADIGIVPVVEMRRQNLAMFRGTGIACRGPVRSILLISKVPFPAIRTLAADAGSRSSVMLARVILAKRYGAAPSILTREPILAEMLEEADAALIIGDPALLLDPATLPFAALDLGEEWVDLTGLPMVFAVWAGRQELVTPKLERAFVDSYEFGRSHVESIVSAEHVRLGISPELARKYITEHIAFELGDRDYQGMELYLRYAMELDAADSSAASERQIAATEATV